MKLPKELEHNSEWVLAGPRGPELPERFYSHPVMAVDGGAHFCRRMNLWIGDSDSFMDAPKADVVLELPEDKDQSDFSCALRLLERQHNYTIHLWGFSGGRKDHELFVWGEVLAFLDQHPESKCILYDQNGRVEAHFVGSGHWRFDHEGLFSLGSMKKIRVKLTGDVKYPIRVESWLPALTSWGLSNIAGGSVKLENDGAAFLYYPEKES